MRNDDDVNLKQNMIVWGKQKSSFVCEEINMDSAKWA